MKKTFNINISGYVFTIDEDAYELLRNYLDTLHNVFSNETDNAELVADLELRMAELLGVVTEGGAKVITIRNVEELISRMGRPEELVETEEEIHIAPGSGTTEETVRQTVEDMTPPPPPPLRRRLFRDPNNSMIGGVCAGLAAFTGIDPTWVRLIAVALAFLSFSTICIVYIILWIVVPAAVTPLQQMQMRGESPTMANIGKNVTDAFRSAADSVNNAVNNAFSNNQAPQSSGSGKRFADGLASIFGFLGRMLAIIAIFVFGVIEFGLAVGLVGCIFSLIVFLIPMGAEWMDPALTGGYEYHVVIVGLICAIGYILAIGIPLFALLWLLLRGYGARQRIMSRGWRTSLLVVWIVSFIVAALTTGYIVNLDKNEFKPRHQETASEIVYDTVSLTDDTVASATVETDTVTIISKSDKPAMNR